MSNEKFQSCIEACLECALICDNCATSCLQEQDVKMMARCIQLDRECSEICYAAARVMGMSGEFSAHLCLLCADVCERCAEECAKHDKMEHCRICAEVCRDCAEECRSMAAELA